MKWEKLVAPTSCLNMLTINLRSLCIHTSKAQIVYNGFSGCIYRVLSQRSGTEFNEEMKHTVLILNDIVHTCTDCLVGGCHLSQFYQKCKFLHICLLNHYFIRLLI